MNTPPSPGRAASDRELLDYLVTLTEMMMSKLDDVQKQLDAQTADLKKAEDDIASIKAAVTTAAAAQQAQIDALTKANTDQSKIIDDLKAGDALTQAQIDALAKNSADVTTAADTMVGHLDTLLGSVGVSGGAPA